VHSTALQKGSSDVTRGVRVAPLAVAGLAGAPPAALWVALTALTGKTYHLAPLLVAMAPSALSLVSVGGSTRQRARRLLPAAGIVTVAAGWLVIALAGIEPEATFIPRQPGGVLGEVVAGALVGAVAGGVLLERQRRREH
jgi:hypothetical protein